MLRLFKLVATIFLLLFAAFLLVAAPSVLPLPWAEPADYPGITVAIIAAVAFAALAFGFAFAAWRVSRRTDREIRHLARSLDRALRDLTLRDDRGSASISELNELVGRQLEAITTRLTTPLRSLDEPMARTTRAVEAPAVPVEAPEALPDPDNVVFHPSTRRTRSSDGLAASAEQVEKTGLEIALAGMLESGNIPISLQPIISVEKGEACGFEVFANVRAGGEDAIDVRRFAGSSEIVNGALFERSMVKAAIDAARRQLGSKSERMPFHVAISAALLGDEDELAQLVDLLALHKGLTRSIVLSLPAAEAHRESEHIAAIDAITRTGTRLAVEGWLEIADYGEFLRQYGFTFAKVSANRLLDRTAARRRQISGVDIVEAVETNELTAIGTEVATDEDAVNLFDMGIEVMTGPRFSGPRRLRAEGEASPRMAGQNA